MQNISCIQNHIKSYSVQATPAMKKTKSKTNSPTTRLISVWLPAEIARELDQTAKARDLTKSQIIRRAIKNEIKKPA